MSGLTPLDDVREHVRTRLPAARAVKLPFDAVEGLALAADIVASENVPPFDNSAVDGYAVRAQDVSAVPVTLDVTGEMAAGAAHVDEVGPRGAVRIMTGAPVPRGCDAVVMVEDTRAAGAKVEVLRTVAPGEGIRRTGSDVIAGDTVLRSGTIVTAAVQAVLGSVNARVVEVWPRPRVGVMSTGDELVDDGSALRPGQIRESNRTMLLRLVEEAGAEAVDLGIVSDDEERVEAALRAAVTRRSCDVVVTSGGVSMGERDVVKAVLARIAGLSWFQIAMKPAKPFAFGTLEGPSGGVPVFGLPGNPVSSLVSFELIARPALEVMMRLAGSMQPRRRATGVIDADVTRAPDGKTHFDRCVARWGDDGRLHVTRVAAQGSHQIAASATANALVEIPDGRGVAAGTDVALVLLGPGLPL